MKEQTTTVKIHSAVISDRGLSQKRPLNEDSYLADPSRRIFAVADGVGGANAGEVASQTAMEVLDDAFRNQEANADIEDLMELAIQRANASIHQMAREHPKLAAMATTVVALHLDGRIATIGHVGDSRLYRLTPEGKLLRDTADHSVVEEEVRAGRMTPEQAAHHPSRNVISRALGAEPSVEVDMKILEVEEGTAFLLCSDGITRHIPDNEIREILSRYNDLEEACTEMKRRCYERGAEDNLTAVVVRVGAKRAGGMDVEDESPILEDTADMHDTLPGLPREASASSPSSPPQQQQRPSNGLTPASRIAFPAPTATEQTAPPADAVDGYQNSSAAPAPSKTIPASSRGGSLGRALLMLLLMAGVGVAAFYAGRYQAGREVSAAPVANANTSVAPTPSPVVNTASDFDNRRREVDRDPYASATRMERENNARPLESTDPEFLYLYGRSLLLLNRHEEAARVFRLALDKLKERPGRDTLKVETKMAATMAAVRSNNPAATAAASKDFEEVLDMVNKTGTSPASNISGPAGVSITDAPANPPQQ